jgi:membrane fusion protein
LFRQEALEHAKTRQYGAIVLAQQTSYWTLCLLFLAVVIALIAFFTLFTTTRKARCEGVLLPDLGVIRVLPVESGVILANHVVEGKAVKAGDLLFVLSSERASSTRGDAKKAVSALLQDRRDSFVGDQSQLMAQGRMRLDSLRRRARDLETEAERADAQIVLQTRRVDLAEQAFKRYGELQATRFVSEAQLNEKQAEFIDQQQKLMDLKRVQSGNGRELIAARADISDLELQTRRDVQAVQREVLELDQDVTENEARREIAIRASGDGVVSAINAQPGQMVAANQALATILPAGSKLVAEIYAPSRSIGFVQPGMKVFLRYEAYPYQKFGQYTATVSEVASSALRPEELPFASVRGSSSEPLYRIRLVLDEQTVKAYGKAMPLKSGMQVEASVVLEERRLIEWVLEPLYSIAGRL